MNSACSFRYPFHSRLHHSSSFPNLSALEQELASFRKQLVSSKVVLEAPASLELQQYRLPWRLVGQGPDVRLEQELEVVGEEQRVPLRCMLEVASPEQSQSRRATILPELVLY
jgi:hypothetical protein